MSGWHLKGRDKLSIRDELSSQLSVRWAPPSSTHVLVSRCTRTPSAANRRLRLLKQGRRSASRTAGSGSGACAWPTKATADWEPGKGRAREPTASRPSRPSAARSRATGRRSLEVTRLSGLAGNVALPAPSSSPPTPPLHDACPPATQTNNGSALTM